MIWFCGPGETTIAQSDAELGKRDLDHDDLRFHLARILQLEREVLLCNVDPSGRRLPYHRSKFLPAKTFQP